MINKALKKIPVRNAFSIADAGGKLPDKPGVYFFKKGKDILYVGKATSLRDRTKSYMSKTVFDTRGPLIEKMVKEANKIDWQETDSVLEALILEASFIKKYQPKYNTKEKSDRSFNYVCITKDKKLAIVRGRILDKEKYDSFFGPFPNNNQLQEALKIIRKIFPYYDYKKGANGREEFYKQIKLAPEDLIENKSNIKNIKLLFEGKKKRIFSNLKKEMNSFAKKREFEKASEIKRQIFALQHINDVALLKEEIHNQGNSLRRLHSILEGQVFSGRSEYSSENNLDRGFRVEAYDIAHMGGKNMVGVMVVLVDGEIEKSEYKKFKIKTQTGSPARRGGNDTGALKEILERRLKHTEWQYPSLVVVDGGIAQINTAKKVLAGLSLKIKVASVLKDERHKPKNIMGSKEVVNRYKKDILLANSEAHRFAINYHKNMRNKNFLK